MEQYVQIGSLRPHPLNPNKQTPETTAKIKASIDATGFYPALVVRQVEGIDGYEILDGHHRLKILSDLNYNKVKIENWGYVDDQQALKYLATLNQLRGQDVAKKRASVLALLRDHEPSEDLAVILPESSEQIDKTIDKWVKRATLGRNNAGRPGFVPQNPPQGVVYEDGTVVLDDADNKAEQYEPVTFLLDAESRRIVNAALNARKAKGEVPGESLDRTLYARILQDQYRGRLLRGVCEDWILGNASSASDPTS